MKVFLNLNAHSSFYSSFLLPREIFLGPSLQVAPWASEYVSEAKEGCNAEIQYRKLYKSIQKKIIKHFLSKIHIKEEKSAVLQ